MSYKLKRLQTASTSYSSVCHEYSQPRRKLHKVIYFLYGHLAKPGISLNLVLTEREETRERERRGDRGSGKKGRNIKILRKRLKRENEVKMGESRQ
jgi:hypothetical protein